MRTHLTKADLDALRARRSEPKPLPQPGDPAYQDLRENIPGEQALKRARVEAETGGDPTPWETGVAGERLVADAVDRLTEWRSIHAIPVGTHGVDIDHLFIGPGGVITANTKHLREPIVYREGKLTVGGVDRTRFLAKAEAEAVLVASVLGPRMDFGVPVFGAIVGSRAQVHRSRGRGGVNPEVALLHVTELSEWLLGLPTVLSVEHIAAIWEMAANGALWSQVEVPPVQTLLPVGEDPWGREHPF